MKKAFLIGINLLIVINLFATTYKSNSIGQKLGKYNNDSEYYLIEKEDNNIIEQELYKNDELIQKKTITVTGTTKTIVIEENSSIIKRTYDNNYIISEDNGSTRTNYYYDKNLLYEKTIISNDQLVEYYKYYYTYDNKLQAILKFDKTDNTFFSTYSYNNDYLSLSISNNNYFKQSKIYDGIINSTEYQKDELINNIEVETLDDENIIVIDKTKDALTKEYFNKGILNKREIYENDILIKVQEFKYDEDFFKSEEVITEKLYNEITKSYDKERKDIISYKNNEILSITTYENNELTSSSTFHDDDIKIENLYKNNEIYCTITYKNDKIIDIQYREVRDDL